MPRKKTKNIVIVGGGRRTAGILEALHDDKDMKIMGVIVEEGERGKEEIKRRFGIPIFTDISALQNGVMKVDAILNLSTDPQISQEVKQVGRSLNIEIMNGPVTKLLWDRLREKKVIAEFERRSQSAHPSMGLEELCILIMSSCIKGTKAEAGALFLLEGKELLLKTAWGLEERIIALIKDKAKEILSQWKNESLPQPIFEKRQWTALPETLGSLPEVRTGICIPLRGRDEKLMGLITLHRRKNSYFLWEEKRLFATFAQYSARAIENTLLYKSKEQLSITDGLTGLYNHRHFHEQLDTEVRRAQKYDLNLSLMMVDLDHFKQFNDTYGHLEGDNLLKKISQVLKNSLRETDFIARYGGEEFAIILPETNKQGATIAAERIRKIVEEQTFGEGGVRMTISVGIASYPDDACLKGDLIKKADEALYKAKRAGRNRVSLA